MNIVFATHRRSITNLSNTSPIRMISIVDNIVSVTFVTHAASHHSSPIFWRSPIAILLPP